MKRTFSWSLVVLCTVGALAVALIGPNRLWGQRLAPEATVDDAGASEFALQLDGQIVAYFQKCTGLTSTSSIATSTTTNQAGYATTLKRPGGELTWDNIMLTRRVEASDDRLWQWRRDVELGNDGGIKTGLIILTVSGVQTGTWQFLSGWPVRISVDNAVEELTIAHSGLERIDGQASRTRSR